MKSNELAQAWLKRAFSNLEKARMGRTSEAVFYEDLCFDCQQAAEKGFKALLVSMGIPPQKTHSLNELIALVERQGQKVPADIAEAVVLSGYAVETRYPGEYEPVTADEYAEAISLAEKTVRWVEMNLGR